MPDKKVIDSLAAQLVTASERESMAAVENMASAGVLMSDDVAAIMSIACQAAYLTAVYQCAKFMAENTSISAEDLSKAVQISAEKAKLGQPSDRSSATASKLDTIASAPEGVDVARN